MLTADDDPQCAVGRAKDALRTAKLGYEDVIKACQM